MWYNIIIVIFLVIMSGTFAGLTLALFSLRLTTLEAKSNTGDKRAMRVYTLRKKGNLLLCTLLLANAASYTIMAIFLGSITSGVIASIIATSLIFLFGEIVPQAVFPRYALAIGSNLSWLIWIFLVVFYPITAPIAWVLDKLLGKESPVLWSKGELSEIIKLYKELGKGIIDTDETRILLGALSFSDMRVRDIMIPKNNVFFLTNETILDKLILERIKFNGHSRIPIVDTAGNQILGILYAKSLIGVTPGKKVAELFVTADLIIHESMKLDDLLNLLLRQKMHMALVINQNSDFSGVATLEDIIEEILKTEIEEKKG